MFFLLKTKNNSLPAQIFFNLQNHPPFHSEERLVNLVKGRECLVGLSILCSGGGHPCGGGGGGGGVYHDGGGGVAAGGCGAHRCVLVAYCALTYHVSPPLCQGSSQNKF